MVSTRSWRSSAKARHVVESWPPENNTIALVPVIVRAHTIAVKIDSSTHSASPYGGCGNWCGASCSLWCGLVPASPMGGFLALRSALTPDDGAQCPPQPFAAANHAPDLAY